MGIYSRVFWVSGHLTKPAPKKCPDIQKKLERWVVHEYKCGRIGFEEGWMLGGKGSWSKSLGEMHGWEEVLGEEYSG